MILLNNLKMFFLAFAVLFTNTLYAYPPQAELFGLNKSMVQLWVSYPNGVTGTGSGVLIKDNHVATDCHVFADAEGVNVVKYHDTFSPIAVYADWEHDLCILKFDNLNLPPVNIRTSEDISYEEKVFSLTFPNDNPVPLPSYGKVKALYPFDGGNIIRTSASFTVGSSGGALFDLDFNLIGITTFKSPGKRYGYFYCLPSEWIVKLLETKESNSLKSTAPPFWSLPDDQKPYFMQVVIPMNEENWSKLEGIAKAWIEDDPNNADAYYYYGLAKHKQKYENEAVTFFKKAFSLNGKHIDSLIEIALIAKETSNQLEFDWAYAEILKIDEDFSESFFKKKT